MLFYTFYLVGFFFVFNFNKPFQINKNSYENAPLQATYYLMD